MEAKGKSVIEQQIAFFRYCHERIDLFKNTIYHRTTIIMAILAFVVSAFAIVMSDFFKNNPSQSHWCFVALVVCSIVFLLSFLTTIIWGIISLFPVKDRGNLENSFNIPGKMRFASSKFVEGKGKREDFEALCNAAKALNTSESILEQIIYELFTMSHQMNLRYDNMRRSCLCLYVNIISFVVTILFYGILRLITIK
ncbi:hypothetical protein R80B4_01173 [Fibrobacteres bacterium R8-0-B4]